MLTAIGLLAILVIIASALAVGPDLSHLFPPVDARIVSKTDPNTRMILGTGGNLLMCPGLKSVKSVRVGDTHLPATLSEDYPMDTSEHPKMQTVDVPLYQLIHTEDGAALQRSVKTNDGVWQAGVPVHVSGEWGIANEASATTPAEPEFAPAPAPKSVTPSPAREEVAKYLNALNLDKLRATAVAWGVPVAADCTRKEAITALMENQYPEGSK